MNEYCHGGDIYSRDIKYDFSANINPLGMPGSAKRALVSGIDRLEAYPDNECRELVSAIADFENVDEKFVLCGSGAADLIYRIVNALRPRKALLTAPAFSEYEKALRNIGCEVNYEFLDEENGFELTENVLEKIPDKDIFFLCTPNNPVGNTVDPELLGMITKRCCECGTALVSDECFMDFVEKNSKLSAKNYLASGVIVLKAFTKIFAMAGLRLGYLLCSNELAICKIRSAGSCWSVSTAAQIAGIAALSEKGYIEKTREYVDTQRRFLAEELKKFGFILYPSEANFILLKSNTDLEALLLEHKIAVRNCEDYNGLEKGFFRIAIRTRRENDILIKTIGRILKNG